MSARAGVDAALRQFASPEVPATTHSNSVSSSGSAARGEGVSAALLPSSPSARNVLHSLPFFSVRPPQRGAFDAVVFLSGFYCAAVTISN